MVDLEENTRIKYEEFKTSRDEFAADITSTNFLDTLGALEMYVSNRSILENGPTGEKDFGLEKKMGSDPKVKVKNVHVDSFFKLARFEYDRTSAVHSINTLDYLLQNAGREENKIGIDVAQSFFDISMRFYGYLSTESVDTFIQSGMKLVEGFRVMPDGLRSDYAWLNVKNYFALNQPDALALWNELANADTLKLFSGLDNTKMQLEDKTSAYDAAKEDYAQLMDKKDIVDEDLDSSKKAVKQKTKELVNMTSRKRGWKTVAILAGTVAVLGMASIYLSMRDASSEYVKDRRGAVACVEADCSDYVAKNDALTTSVDMFRVEGKTKDASIANHLATIETQKTALAAYEGTSNDCPDKLLALNDSHTTLKQSSATCVKDLGVCKTDYGTSSDDLITIKQENTVLENRNNAAIEDLEICRVDYARCKAAKSTGFIQEVRDNIDDRDAIVIMAGDYIRNANDVWVSGKNSISKVNDLYDLWIEGHYPNAFLPEDKEKIMGHLKFFNKPKYEKCIKIGVGGK